MRTSLVLGLGLAALSVLPACSSAKTTERRSSTVEGRLALTSFETTPSAVEAVDEHGERYRAPVSMDGAFRLKLAKAHVYKLSVVGPAGDVPIVFRRSNGRLDRTFRLSTDGALVALGYVHHVERAPIEAATASPPAPSSPASTSLIRPASNEHEDDDDDDDTHCEDGRAGASGGVLDDSDSHEDADGLKPMALPDRNAPDTVAGCHEDDDDDDDDDHDDEVEDHDD